MADKTAAPNNKAAFKTRSGSPILLPLFSENRVKVDDVLDWFDAKQVGVELDPDTDPGVLSLLQAGADSLSTDSFEPYPTRIYTIEVKPRTGEDLWWTVEDSANLSRTGLDATFMSLSLVKTQTWSRPNPQLRDAAELECVTAACNVLALFREGAFAQFQSCPCFPLLLGRRL